MDTSSQLSEFQISLIRSYIEPGEALRWIGREPRSRYMIGHGLRIAGYGLWVLFFSLLAGKMILMNPLFLKNSLQNSLPVLTPIMISVGGVFLLAREIYQLGKRTPHLYAVTSRRALVISTGRQAGLRAYGPDSLARLTVKRRKHGRGDILFERTVQWVIDSQGRSTSQARVIGFYGLPEVDSVLLALQQIGNADLLLMTCAANPKSTSHPPT